MKNLISHCGNYLENQQFESLLDLFELLPLGPVFPQLVHPGHTRTTLDQVTSRRALFARMRTRRRCQGQPLCTNVNANEASETLTPRNAQVTVLFGGLVVRPFVSLKDSRDVVSQGMHGHSRKSSA